MSHKLISLFLFISLLFNCNNYENKISKESLFIYRSDNYDFLKKRKYSLKINKNDSIIGYAYIFKSNNEKNININYHTKNNSLKFFIDTFNIAQDSSFTIPSISTHPFYYYRNIDNSASHYTDPLIFNKDYGLLALGNSYGGPNLIFIKKENDSIYLEEIGNKLKAF